MLLVVGVFMFIITFCGCVGSLRENICLLQTVSEVFFFFFNPKGNTLMSLCFYYTCKGADAQSVKINCVTVSSCSVALCRLPFSAHFLQARALISNSSMETQQFCCVNGHDLQCVKNCSFSLLPVLHLSDCDLHPAAHCWCSRFRLFG